MIYIIQIIIAFILIIFSVVEVQACSVCVTAFMDRVLPPIQIWCLISLSWFLLTSLISSVFKIKIFGVPKIIMALVLVFGCMVIGAGFLGPFIILPLAITPAIAFIRSFPQTNKGKWSQSAWYSVQIVGFIATIGILLTAYQTGKIYRTRTLGQYIVKWSLTGPSLSACEQLVRQEPASLTDYRYILENGKDHVLVFAGERIAAIGDPEEDSKRLTQTIERVRNITNTYSIVQSLEKSLQDLQSRTKKEK